MFNNQSALKLKHRYNCFSNVNNINKLYLQILSKTEKAYFQNIFTKEINIHSI